MRDWVLESRRETEGEECDMSLSDLIKLVPLFCWREEGRDVIHLFLQPGERQALWTIHARGDRTGILWTNTMTLCRRNISTESQISSQAE